MSEVCRECGRQVGRVNWLDGECVMCFSGWYPPEKLNQETMTNKTNKLIKQKIAITNWLRDEYGLDVDDTLDAGDVVEVVEMAVDKFCRSARKEERARILTGLETSIGAAQMGVTKEKTILEVLIDLHNYLSNQQSWKKQKKL